MRERDTDSTTPTVNAAGVDVTLVQEMLRLTPLERLRLNDRMVRTILELRDAFAAGRRQPTR